jgi:methionyl aminopeptidase
LIVDGWHGDSSRMYAVGPIARKAERLIEVTYEAMMRGIAAVKPGATTGDIGHAIQTFVEPQGMSVVRDFCGHGLGRCSTTSPTSCMSAARRRRGAQARHVLHHRADDQSRRRM